MKSYLEVAKQLAHEAGEIAMSFYAKNVESDIKKENPHNIVTEADLACEKHIVEGIREAFPDHGIIGEEGSSFNEDAQIKWIIDPIDGTTNFFHTHPFFAISIGVMDGNEIVAGVINCPKLDECFSASRGTGTFLNDEPISVSGVKTLSTSLLTTGFSPNKGSEHFKKTMHVFEHILKDCNGMRRAGAAAIDLCYVAAGRADGFIEYGLNSWDIAAGVLIVKEAGGTVTAADGSPIDIFNRNIVATNGKVHDEIIEYIKQL